MVDRSTYMLVRRYITHTTATNSVLFKRLKMWNGGKDINESGETVLLLDPTTNTLKKKTNDNEGHQNPSTSSFVGGHAIHFPNDEYYSKLINTEHTEHSGCNSMKCEICSDAMYLLLQIYAPLDALDRTLCVFACNKASCIQKVFTSSGSGKGFSIGGKGVVKCTRSQCYREDNDKDDDRLEGNNENISNEEKNAVPRDKVDIGGWGDGDDGGDWGSTNPWDDESDIDGNENDIDDPTMDDLEAMLDAMEANPNSIKKVKKMKNQTKKAIPVRDPVQSSLPSFQKFELEVYDEPYGINVFSDLDVDEDDMIGISQDDDLIVQKMLSSYLQDEDDDGIKAILQKGMKSYSQSNSSGGRGNPNGNGEKDERLPAVERAFLLFSDRIKRAPYQVVRYAYDGIPLWSM